MSIKKYVFEIDEKLGLIVANFGGKLNVQDMLDFVDELYGHENYSPNFLTVYDFRSSSAIGFRIDVISFIERLRVLRRNSGKRRIGFIVGSVNQRFLIRTFISLNKGLNLDVEMFENKMDCLNWISKDALVIKKIEEILVSNKVVLIDQMKFERNH